MTNPYCERLGIQPPDLEDLALRPDVKLFHLMVAALLERGGPMALEEIAARLDDCGVVVYSGDLETSLQKAWHGLKPIYRAPDKRFALRLEGYELSAILESLGLKSRSAVPPLPPRLVTRVDPDEPLTTAELDAILHCRSLQKLGVGRTMAAILEVHGAPMTLEAIESQLPESVRERISMRSARQAALLTRMIEELSDGRFALSTHAPDELRAMRRFARALAGAEQAEREANEHREAALALRRKEVEARHLEAARVALALRRCVLRVAIDSAKPVAGALLDVERRSIRTFVGAESMTELAQALQDYDLVAALDVRAALAGLGLDAERWRVIDLSDTPKTRRINKSGRTLKITPELLMRGTIRAGKPLGDPKTLKQYLAGGEHTKLEKRLGSDVKALFSYYSYGRLHGYVRLRWGFINDVCGVDWRVDGEASLYEILRSASEQNAAVDLVVSASAPGWSDPWSRAFPAEVVALEMSHVVVRAGGREHAIDRYEIQAVRIREDQLAS